MNVIARLEYELAYYDFAVHRFNHYTTRTPPPVGWISRFFHSVFNETYSSSTCIWWHGDNFIPASKCTRWHFYFAKLRLVWLRRILLGLFSVKVILVEEQQYYYLTHSWWRYKGVHTFLKSISPKVNLRVRLEFELTSHDVVLQDISDQITGTLPALRLLPRQFQNATEIVFNVRC